MNAVPRTLNLGVPSLYDGIGTSSAGTPFPGMAVFARVPGRSITILKAPTSESCSDVKFSSIVEWEYDLCGRILGILSVESRKDEKYCAGGVGNERGVNMLLSGAIEESGCNTIESKPAVLGGVTGKLNAGCG